MARPAIFIGALTLAMSVGAAVAAFPPAHPSAADALAARQHEEDALAGYMVRIGYDRFEVACGYEMAKRGASRDVALNECPADFNFTGPFSGRP